MSKRKYKKGRPILTISDFDSCDSIWYIWNGATRHRSCLISLQYRTLLETIKQGRLFVADRITE